MEKYVYQKEIEEKQKIFLEQNYVIAVSDLSLMKEFLATRPKNLCATFEYKGVVIHNRSNMIDMMNRYLNEPRLVATYTEAFTLEEVEKKIYYAVAGDTFAVDEPMPDALYRLKNGNYLIAYNNHPEYKYTNEFFPNAELVCIINQKELLDQLDLRTEQSSENLCGGGGGYHYIGDLQGSIRRALIALLQHHNTGIPTISKNNKK